MIWVEEGKAKPFLEKKVIKKLILKELSEGLGQVPSSHSDFYTHNSLQCYSTQWVGTDYQPREAGNVRLFSEPILILSIRSVQ